VVSVNNLRIWTEMKRIDPVSSMKVTRKTNINEEEYLKGQSTFE
jgi:hypothetical protein